MLHSAIASCQPRLQVELCAAGLRKRNLALARDLHVSIPETGSPTELECAAVAALNSLSASFCSLPPGKKRARGSQPAPACRLSLLVLKAQVCFAFMRSLVALEHKIKHFIVGMIG